MKKPESLRDLMTQAVPAIKADPTRLSLFIDRGSIRVRPGSLSFEYAYSVNLVVQDYAGDPDAVIVPVIAWIAEHQPELLQRQDSQAFDFESELLAEGVFDLSLTIALTERVRVVRADGGVTVEHLEDRLPPDIFPGAEGARLWQGFAQDLATGVAVPVAPRP